MKLYHNKQGERRIHIEDSDNYWVTDDHGVDVFMTWSDKENCKAQWGRSS